MKHLKMTRLIYKFRSLGLLGLSLLVAVSSLALSASYVLADEDVSNSGYGSGKQTEAQKRETGVRKKAAEELRQQTKKSRESNKLALEEVKSAREDQKLEKSRGLVKELTEGRLGVLEKLQSGEYTNKCRVAAKTEANAAINAVIARLKQNQAELINLQTFNEVRSLIKDDILGKNHVYVAVLPAVRGMCISDKIIGLVEGKLIKIALRLKADGLDTVKLLSLLTETKTTAQAAYAAYKKIATNPGSATYKSDLAVAKAKLKEAKSNLSVARDEIDLLKETVSNDSTNQSVP